MARHTFYLACGSRTNSRFCFRLITAQPTVTSAQLTELQTRTKSNAVPKDTSKTGATDLSKQLAVCHSVVARSRRKHFPVAEHRFFSRPARDAAHGAYWIPDDFNALCKTQYAMQLKHGHLPSNAWPAKKVPRGRTEVVLVNVVLTCFTFACPYSDGRVAHLNARQASVV